MSVMGVQEDEHRGYHYYFRVRCSKK